MENSSVISVLSLIIVLLFFLFATFLFTVKTEKKLSNRLLAIFLIITAVDISVFFYSDFIKTPPIIEMLRIQISSFKDPFLFLYILSVIYSDLKLKTKYLALTLPWLIGIIILIPNFFMVSYDEKMVFLSKYSLTFEGQIIIIINRVIEIIYIIAEIYYLLRYRKLLLENYTNKKVFYHYHWLKQLIIFILIGQALTFVKGTIRDTEGFDEDFINVFRVILLLFGLFFSFWLVLKALLSPKLFRGIGINLKLSKEMMVKDETENPHTDNKQIQHLKAYMINKEPFLDSSLTIQSLANNLKVSSQELSILINQELNQHFFDFINQYRIEKAKKILENASKNKLTVLEILYDVGFNSKSSFNTAFKKHTATTPTNYRKTTQKQ